MRLDEISLPDRLWIAQDRFPPAKYPLYLHAVPSSWGVAYFGNQWSDFLKFVQLRGQPPFYDAEHEEAHVKLSASSYAWGTRSGDPNLWLPNRSTTNSWFGSWKRFMVDFAYGRGAYMLYPNLANATGLATSLFLAGDHFEASAVKNPRQAPLLETSEATIAQFTIPFPSYGSLPLVNLHCDDIDRVTHAQHGNAFINRIAGLSPEYETLVYTCGALVSWVCVAMRRRIMPSPVQKHTMQGPPGSHVDQGLGDSIWSWCLAPWNSLGQYQMDEKIQQTCLPCNSWQLQRQQCGPTCSAGPWYYRTWPWNVGRRTAAK